MLIAARRNMRVSTADAASILSKWATESAALRVTFSLTAGGVDITFVGIAIRFDDAGFVIGHSINSVLGSATISIRHATGFEFQTGREGPPGDEISASVENALIIKFRGALLGLFEQKETEAP
jgi:hypothetical protein